MDLTAAEFEHVLGTFPLVPDAERAAALRWYHSRQGIIPFL